VADDAIKRRTLWSILLTPSVIVLSIVLFAVYLLFDLREGGPTASLTTTHLASVPRYAKLFGVPFTAGMVVLDVLLAVVGAVLMVQSFRMVKAYRSARRAGVCTLGTSLLVGFSAFACPGCPLPLLATLGTTFVATSLPLYGLEFKILALAITGLMLWWVLRIERRATSARAVPATTG
jgi:hypothetical protein